MSDTSFTLTELLTPELPLHPHNTKALSQLGGVSETLRKRSIYPDGNIYPFKKNSRKPFNAICQLFDPLKRTIGTGVAISPNLVLTAGHNLILPAFPDMVEPEIIQGIHGKYRTSHPINYIDDFAIHPKWVSQKSGKRRFNRQYDIALIRTVDPLEHYIDIWPWNELPHIPEKIYICGYPIRDFSRLHFGEGQFESQSKNILAHSANTEAGMSGGIAMMQTEEKAHVFGIHVGGFNYLPGTFSGDVNKVLYFTPEILNWINKKI